MATKFNVPLHPGYPSRTPTKGSSIAAEISSDADKPQDCAIPPNTVVFVSANQTSNVAQVQATVTGGNVAGVAIAGVSDPASAIKFRDSAGRFGIANAGQCRLVGKKSTAKDTWDDFKPMDHVYVNVANDAFKGDDSYTGDKNTQKCGFEYAGGTSYELPIMIDGTTFKSSAITKTGSYERIGTVVGISDDSDLLTIELKIA